jgi:hypothetical protein
VSKKVWYCANCGYEVTSRGRCHSCGDQLIPSPMPELESGPDDDEVGYRLGEWDDPTRVRLIQTLISASIPHRFEDEELVVMAADEAKVDRIVAQAAGGSGEADADEPASEEEQQWGVVAANLYAAANRLRENPTDMEADFAVGEASAALFALDDLPRTDPDTLAAIGRVTRRLLGALGAEEAMESEIRNQSEILCRLVAPAAGQAAEQAEEVRARTRLASAARQLGRSPLLPESDPGSMNSASAAANAADEAAARAAETAEADNALEPAAAGPDVAGDVPVTSTDDQAVPAPADADTTPAEANEEPNDEYEDLGLVPFQLSDTPVGEVLGAGLVGETNVVVATANGPEGGTGGVEPAQEAQAGDGEASDAPPDDEELEDDQEAEEQALEVVYELDDWLPDQRVELSLLLETAGVAYRWDEADLTVATEHETEVESLFSQVEGILEEDDEARYRSIEELFGAADRLAGDPDDGGRRQDFLEASGAAEGPTPVGLDDSYWWRVRNQTRLVVAALESDDRADEVASGAALLADVLREMV